jgi:hypothetical protein
MNDSQCEVEAFVRTDDLCAISKHIESMIGEVQDDGQRAGAAWVFANATASLVLQPSQDGYTSVWVRGSTRWPSSPAFARFLSARLRCAVRCDPESEYPDVSPYSDVFLHIEDEIEGLVDWGDA